MPISPTLPLPRTRLLSLKRIESSLRASATSRFAMHSAVAVLPVPTSPWKIDERVLFGDEIDTSGELAAVVLLVPGAEFAEVQKQPELVVDAVVARLEAQQRLLAFGQRSVGQRSFSCRRLCAVWFTSRSPSAACRSRCSRSRGRPAHRGVAWLVSALVGVQAIWSLAASASLPAAVYVVGVKEDDPQRKGWKLAAT